MAANAFILSIMALHCKYVFSDANVDTILTLSNEDSIIPVLDVSKYDRLISSPASAEKSSKLVELLGNINQIMETIGAMYVINTGFEFNRYYNDLVSSSKNFFNTLSLEDKMLYNMGSWGSPGYQPPFAETIGYSLSNKSKPDALESFKFWWNTSEWNLTLPIIMESTQISANLKNNGVRYYNNLLNHVANKLFIILGKAYTQDTINIRSCDDSETCNADISGDDREGNDRYFYGLIHSDPIGELKISNYYVNQESDELINAGYFRQSAHSDLGFLTLNKPDPNVSGLQFFINNKWYDVNCTNAMADRNRNRNDCFLINGGNIMVSSTNNKWKAAIHRVLLNNENSNQSRMSIIAFFGTKAKTYNQYFQTHKTNKTQQIEQMNV